MNNPTIVVVAFNRPDSLSRLLSNLAQCEYPQNQDVQLIISVDGEADTQVEEVSEVYQWKFGDKKIIKHKTRLGLKQHILQCGDLSEKYDSLILLEDDLYLSRYFYKYASESAKISQGESRIAGISLYCYRVAESCFLPFIPLESDSSYYYMKVPCSWGQLWTKEQWGSFRKWLLSEKSKDESSLPQYVRDWGANSWKRLFFNYMVQNEKYFLYPFKSFSTNLEEPGTNATTRNLYNVPVNDQWTELVFENFENSRSIYDEYFEIEKIALDKWSNCLKDYDYEVDFYGRRALKKPYILVSSLGNDYEMEFGSTLLPTAKNVALNIPGRELALVKKEDISKCIRRPLNEVSASLLNMMQKHLELSLDLSIVVPIDDESELIPIKIKINQMRSVEWILMITDSMDKNAIFKKLNNPKQVKILSLSGTLKERLKQAFKHASSNYSLWASANTKIDFTNIHRIIHFLNSKFEIHWLNGKSNFTEGIHEKRWNARLAKEDPFRASIEDMELHIFRTQVLNSIIADANFTFNVLINRISCLTTDLLIGEKTTANTSELNFRNLNMPFYIIPVYRKFLKGKPFWKYIFAASRGLPPILHFNESSQSFNWE